MSKQFTSAPNSAIDTATPHAEHQRIAEQALTKSRAPSELLTADERRVIEGTDNSTPSDVGK